MQRSMVLWSEAQRREAVPHPSLRGVPGASKRLLDAGISALGLLCLSPLLLVIACLIKCDSRGPVLFRQRRVGLHGREFWMYKFRSMVMDADARLDTMHAESGAPAERAFKPSNDPRVTRIGRLLRRTSLDELPQFFNVLRGDMSLVGPRPMPTYEAVLQPPEYQARLQVLPGCSGLWQVSGRSHIGSFQHRFELDWEYVRSWSFALDLLILAKTVRIVLQGDGAW